MKEKREKSFDDIGLSNFLNSFRVVSMLGLAIILLGISRFNGLNIPPLFMLGISTASLCFILNEFLNFKRIMANIMQLISFISILFMPLMPFFQSLSIDTINRYNDCFSLVAMGATLFLISTKGLSEITNFFLKLNEALKKVDNHFYIEDKQEENLKKKD